MSRDLEQIYRPVLRDLRATGGLTTVELAGLPRTGKSLFADAVRGMLVKAGASVALAPRDTWDCPIGDKWSFDYTVWSVSTLVHAWLDAKHRGTDIFIADRGWFDALLWTDLKLEMGLVTAVQVAALRQWLLADGIWPSRMVVLPFTSADVSALLARGKERRLHSGASRVTTETNLTLLVEAVAVETAHATERGVVVQPVDITGQNVEAAIHLAAAELLTGLKKLASSSDAAGKGLRNG